MNRREVLELLYDRYIEPTKGKDGRYIGVEIEMPLINLDKEAVDFAVVHDLTRKFRDEFGFYTAVVDENGDACSVTDFSNDDILSYDCSYNNLELSFGKETDLLKIQSRFERYYWFLQARLTGQHYTLSGLGVNPYRIYNHNVPIPNARYRMLFHHLSSYDKYRLPMFFHPYPDYGMFSSASQIQLDVGYDDLIETIRAFTLLEPLKAILFSNSVLTGDREDMLCCRDMLWENSTHGINLHNVGMFDTPPANIDELLEYIASTSIYCTGQDGRYINFPPVNIVEYFGRDTIRGEYFEDGAYREIEFTPRESDINYLRSFKFEDLTWRGTIEFRSVCCQPIKDAFTVAAFHLGLIGRARELNELLGADRALYGHGYNASELRKLFNLRAWPGFADRAAVSKLLLHILDLAKASLASRGLGEERFLEPLYGRAERLTNPARELLRRTDAGEDVASVIRDYAQP
ncbi:MAG: glutamylcysteine synthetase [Clostridiales Family XIII bacterium]|jgi:gamma-glutamylcysteine synthetase|nr:glutamylcysteine synthetase [Clostridiales Family XIII bacterium]